MNCKTVIKNLDDYMDGELRAATRDRLLRHLTVCPNCEDLVARELLLRRALKELPAPAPDSEFVDRVFSRAVCKAKRRPHYYSGWMKLAASILLVVALGYLSNATLRFSRTDAAHAIVAMNVKEEIRLVFHSNEDISNVTFSIEMPENVELAGYGGKRQLVWQGALTKGSNLLVLPVIARGPDGGSLVAGIRHGQKNRQFNLQLTVNQSSDMPVDRVGTHRMSVLPI